MLLLLLFCVYLPIRETRPIASKPDYELYHTKDALFSTLTKIIDRNPSFMKMEERVKQNEEYSVKIPIITVEPGGFTSNHTKKLRVLMSFGEHGREIVTAELALRFVQSLSNETEFAQYCSNDCSRIKEILTHTIWKIIPMENPNGRDMFEQGKLCERKNGRGVDINRNWDIDFGTKEVDYDPSEEYPGAHAFSEPETQILNKLTEEFKQHVWIGVHSGMCAMFMPYDHIGELPNGTSAEAQLDILKSVKTTNLEASCQFGPGGKTVGYLAHGTGTDYMYSVLKVPLAFTWEIYGDSTADYYDCYKAFNPTTKPLLEETLFRWMEATFHLLLLLPNHPDVDLELLSSPVEQEANPLDLIREQTKFQKQFNESKSYQSISTTAKSTKPRGLNLVGFCLLGFGLAYILYLIRVKRRRIIVKDAKLDI